MPEATLTSKGQITIPREVRAALGLKPGDRVAFELRGDGTAVVRPRTSDALDLFGAIKPKVRGVSIDAMKDAVRRSGTRR